MFQSIATGFSAHSTEKGGNVLGLDTQESNVVMLLYALAVRTPELEALARVRFRASLEAMKEYAASLDSLVDWTYLNYADGSQVSRSPGPATTTDLCTGPVEKLRRRERRKDSCCGS